MGRRERRGQEELRTAKDGQGPQCPGEDQFQTILFLHIKERGLSKKISLS